MEKERAQRPVFIVGCTRSGTKLMLEGIAFSPDSRRTYHMTGLLVVKRMS